MTRLATRFEVSHTIVRQDRANAPHSPSPMPASRTSRLPVCMRGPALTSSQRITRWHLAARLRQPAARPGGPCSNLSTISRLHCPALDSSTKLYCQSRGTDNVRVATGRNLTRKVGFVAGIRNEKGRQIRVRSAGLQCQIACSKPQVSSLSRSCMEERKRARSPANGEGSLRTGPQRR
ncbi:hypothetical protein OBBRIDRAFT_549670 [Obba rivulosa]|uniref:Uncharacterized protein n=1 Tax=Obba rivulosa TaxID=1052685 RepID=A0A8E2DLK0_9APHY|nr:hypothetical protein OBBRIDRAFT_549670 [Obba rivulosa]